MFVCFQWASIGLPVVFQCVPTMQINTVLVAPVVFQCVTFKQINTGSPLEHHWVLASASVVPVASQCNCGSNGLPVWSVQRYPSVLTESGQEVIRSGHFPARNPLCIQLVWWELFELNWFYLTCNPKYTKTTVAFQCTLDQSVYTGSGYRSSDARGSFCHHWLTLTPA